MESGTEDGDASQKRIFWNAATRYIAAIKDDEPFVNEMAYVMVTLHRTGS